ncbi:SDR family oxidoreductase [Algicella marina]|uniref:SDR family oxidoreductase n=1 Tax=Algicella marina TaxID=2683284 RepID=A0A6P1SX48_9RHOB|nr:SDR family oxidoreductase [Algicella marina]QHQ34105.1 SDR family oxidoreductase [Algicella marina]
MSERPVCVVTGGSSGIGAATAELAARDGFDVVLTYKTDETGAKDVQAKVEELGAKALILRLDVGKPDDIEHVFRKTVDMFGRLDALINNAGIVDQATRLDGLDSDRIANMLNVNVTGSILCAKAAVRLMSREFGGHGGSIVNISSAAARLGGANMYLDYGASKGAIDTFTRGLAAEQAAHGVRVNAVRPGVIETELHAKGGTPDRVTQIAASLPMKRAGTAHEVAEGVVWLISEKASYVTGAILDISGGR